MSGTLGVAGWIAALAAIACGGEVPPIPTPTLTPITADGIAKAVRDARGDVVLVNVWAVWCDPCRREFPALLTVERELAERGFTLILVSADFADQRAKVLQFLAQQGVGFPSFLKDEDDMAFIGTLEPQWSGALPATFLYDRTGKLRDFWEGEASYEKLAGKVTSLLAETPGRRVQGGSS
jgi:thiol-disulfide isomerase/thioredoxin